MLKIRFCIWTVVGLKTRNSEIRDANVQDETTSLHFAGLINFTLTLQFDYATRKYRITENKNFLCNMRYSPSVLYVVAPDAKTLSPFRL